MRKRILRDSVNFTSGTPAPLFDKIIDLFAWFPDDDDDDDDDDDADDDYAVDDNVVHESYLFGQKRQRRGMPAKFKSFEPRRDIAPIFEALDFHRI